MSEAGDPGGPAPQPLRGDPAARVLVAGATGRTGALAARIVWRHPRLELAAATSRSHAGERLDALYPYHRVPIVLEELDLDRLEQVEAAIVAYPHGAAAPIVAGLRGLGALVVDLSADFRLRELPEYERWYGPHGDPDLLANSVYGLTELNREGVREAELIGNPGCYPTAALLALAPLAEAGLVVDVVIDAKSGVSGAGRNGGERLSFINVDQNLTPYGTGGHRHSPEIAQGLAALGAGEARVTFMPHLLPLDQGLLASCYVTLSREVEPEELRNLYRRPLRGRAVRRAGRLRPGCARGARHKPVPNPRHPRRDGRARGRLRRDRQSLEGRVWAGGAEPERDARCRRDGGARVTFFRSRWAPAPNGIEEADAGALAPAFRAAGVACGLKDGGATDVGLLACDDPAVSSALLLTRNAAAAAPVRLCRERCDQSAIRAAVVNSGNANAATGERGFRDAVALQTTAAAALGLVPERVAVAETGTIGVPLDVEAVLAGIPAAAARLGERGDDFAEAIMTTDRGPKRCCVSQDGVTLSAQAKGAGMIEPGFATMLCFVQTDAVVEDPDRALRDAVAASFERITVDGQMSTNDTVLLQATGASGRPLPGGLLESVLLQLALDIVADGEGASRVGRIEVVEAASPEEARRVAHAIANSPLVKTALAGRDPNWGRIAQAAGMALAGETVPGLGSDAIAAEEIGSSTPEAELSLRLGRGDASAHLYFSDLTEAYVALNSRYTT